MQKNGNVLSAPEPYVHLKPVKRHVMHISLPQQRNSNNNKSSLLGPSAQEQSPESSKADVRKHTWSLKAQTGQRLTWGAGLSG